MKVLKFRVLRVPTAMQSDNVFACMAGWAYPEGPIDETLFYQVYDTEASAMAAGYAWMTGFNEGAGVLAGLEEGEVIH